MRSGRERISFPTCFGAEDHEHRGVNDREIRFKAYSEKVHAALSASGMSASENTGGVKGL